LDPWCAQLGRNAKLEDWVQVVTNAYHEYEFMSYDAKLSPKNTLGEKSRFVSLEFSCVLFSS
jgi:hypothetical protein